MARVVTIDDVAIEARGPGEIAGPGAAVTVDLTNESVSALDLDGIAVNAYGPDGSPMSPSTSPPAAAVNGELAAGTTARGVYLFQVTGGAPALTVEINYSGSPNVVLVQR